VAEATSKQNIVIGARRAMPVLVGWAAVTNSLAGRGVLFGVIFM